eukprot:CAMPEP_0174269880 /NCGR_PEP_ID=MMETSP0439-20130205/42602_1 /TAXON_ID=0 /ORGANISM="Stereomyxa ramosa, Strain Chinc5" /LENGTH=303 /DNA_ID=CAMNT_0015358879 /DNA_START=86 /DNA_END=997 /DNA_ORIENTATION=+
MENPPEATRYKWTRKLSDVSAPFIIEFLGTFFLVFTITVTGATLSAGADRAIAIGCVLMVVVFAGGHISGAHYNPAVTFAVALSRRGTIDILNAVIYIIVQIVAGISAAFLVWAILDGTVEIKPSVTQQRAFALEVFWTFLLCTVVLQTATTKAQAGNSFFGLAIGFTVLSGAYTVGPLSGGVFNPSVGTGPLIVDAIHHRDADRLKYMWIYWCGPMLGALGAAGTFYLTNFREYHESFEFDNLVSLYSHDVENIAGRAAGQRDQLVKFEQSFVERTRSRGKLTPGYLTINDNDSADDITNIA